MAKVAGKSKGYANNDLCLVTVTTPNGPVTLTTKSLPRMILILDTLKAIGFTADNALSQPYTYCLPSEFKRSA
jgi:hypothetical protein